MYIKRNIENKLIEASNQFASLTTPTGKPVEF